MSTDSFSAADAGHDVPGVRRVRRLTRPVAVVTVLVLAALIAVLDQVSKHWAESALDERWPRAVLGDLLQLRLLYNSGAAWGMGAGITPVVTALQIAICIGAVVFVVRAVRSLPWVLALGCVVGGALGNIHDRILRPPGPFRGEVVDFIALPHWPVFNVADMAVVTGAVLIVLLGVIGVAADPAAADREDGVVEDGVVEGGVVEDGEATVDPVEGDAATAGTIDQEVADHRGDAATAGTIDQEVADHRGGGATAGTIDQEVADHRGGGGEPDAADGRGITSAPVRRP